MLSTLKSLLNTFYILHFGFDVLGVSYMLTVKFGFGVSHTNNKSSGNDDSHLLMKEKLCF